MTTRQASSPPPAIPQTRGIRIEEPGLGAVSISDIDGAGFDAAYPWGWASLDDFDPDLVSEASDGALTRAQGEAIKVLLACAVVREFVEPRRQSRAPATSLLIPLVDDALTFIRKGAARPLADVEVATILATMFGQPIVTARRLVDAARQKAER